jgi:GNAT superfamily N-acetyltransferase
MSDVTTRFPADADLGGDVVRHLAGLVNACYDDAESGMWQEPGTRTGPDEIAGLLRDRALILAELDGRVVGSVKVMLMPDGVGEFGMLVADPGQRGRGVGRVLVAAAEDWARRQGCRTMRLELLTPRGWTHPSKEFLRGWYTRLGYVPQRTERFEDEYAHLVPRLATPCDFTVWHKPLT